MNGSLRLIKESTSPAFFRWRPACWIKVHGPDAFSFLQGQFTNDLRRLERERAVYGLWLTVKGKALADSFVLRADAPDAFWIASYASTAAVVRERLESHIIADEVSIDDFTSESAGVSLFGPAADFLGGDAHGGMVFPGRRARSRQLDWVGPATRSTVVTAAVQNLPELDLHAVDVLRIRDGIPCVPIDIGPADLPNEGGLEVDAISYTKGCYLGQEVMARLKAMGQIRRRLVRVLGRGEVPPMPAALFAAERQVGELRSAVADGAGEFIGLAMVSRLNVTADSQLAFATGAAATIRLMEAP